MGWICHRFVAGLFEAALSLLLLACCLSVAAGVERSVEFENSALSGAATGQAEPEDRAEKERVATAAVYLLVLVIVASLGLLAVIVLWGRRVRRVVRKPTARITPGDELWYLKPTKNDAASDSVPPNSDPADGE